MELLLFLIRPRELRIRKLVLRKEKKTKERKAWRLKALTLISQTLQLHQNHSFMIYHPEKGFPSFSDAFDSGNLTPLNHFQVFSLLFSLLVQFCRNPYFASQTSSATPFPVLLSEVASFFESAGTSKQNHFHPLCFQLQGIQTDNTTKLRLIICSSLYLELLMQLLLKFHLISQSLSDMYHTAK